MQESRGVVDTGTTVRTGAIQEGFHTLRFSHQAQNDIDQMRAENVHGSALEMFKVRKIVLAPCG